MILLYYGPDDFSMREAVQKRLHEALPSAETADLNTTRLAAGQVTADALRFACEATPFLADRRVVLVEEFFTRSSARRGPATRSNEGQSEEGPEEGGGSAVMNAVAEYLPSVPANTHLLFIESKVPPKTGPIFRALEQAKVKQQYFPTLAGMPLVRWIRDRAKTTRGQISDPASQLLATFVGGDLRTLSTEIEKLTTYAGMGKTVEPADVRLLVNQTGEVNVFALVDAVAQGQLNPALAALHRLLEAGERPERILGMLARQVRLLIQARELAGRRAGAEETAKVLGLAGFPLRKVQEQARLFTPERVREMHALTLAADVSIKTGRQEPALALELLVVGLAAKR